MVIERVPLNDALLLSVSTIRQSELNPRKVVHDDALLALAKSIQAHGLIEPIVVRPGRGQHPHWEVLAGARRFAAAQLAGLNQVPVVVRRCVSDHEALELILVENLQREDLDPLTEAEGYRRLITDYGYTQVRLGKAVSKSQAWVSHRLSLLQLPVSVRACVQSGELSPSHAKALADVRAPKEVVEQMAREVVEQHLPVAEVERQVRDQRSQIPANNQGGHFRGRPILTKVPVNELRPLFNALRSWVADGGEFHSGCRCDQCMAVRSAFETLRGRVA